MQAILLILGLTVGLASSDTDRRDPSTNATHIAVKQTKPLRVVYKNHIGPYWTVGPVFREVSEYMVEHGQTGSVFARYPDHPKNVRAASMRTEIGFVVNGEHQPQASFRSMIQKSELVAYQFLDTSNPNINKQFDVMSKWIRSNGYKPLGPIIEIHHRLFDRKGLNKPSVEIQIPVRKILQEQDIPNFMEVPDEVIKKSVSAIQVPPTPVPAKTPEKIVTQPMQPKKVRPSFATKPEATKIPIPRPPKVVMSSDLESKPINRSYDKPVQKTNNDTLDTMTITELIDSEYYDQVARRIMPHPDAIEPGQEIWFGQLIFKMKAIARGIKKLYPGKGVTVTRLVNALSSRYEIQSAHFENNPLNQAVFRVNGYNDAFAKTRREMMRHMDSMLGRLAVKRLTADEVTEELIDIVDRLYDLMRDD